MAYNIIEPVSKGIYVKKILLEKGSYGIKVLVDVNGNGEMDLIFLVYQKNNMVFQIT